MLTGKIQGSVSFSNRTVDLGYRARYEENIGIHDIRREALVEAEGKFLRWNSSNKISWLCQDDEYLISERMKFAGYNNTDTFFGSYASKLSTGDSIASYWNKKRRTVYLEGF